MPALATEPMAGPVPSTGSGPTTAPSKAVGNLQGAVVPFEPVAGPCAWKAADYRDSNEHIYVMTPSDVAELEAAVARVIASDAPLHETTRAHFPLPLLGPTLERILREVQWGRGFALLRGLPVKRWSRREALTAYWGLGTYWGRAVSQNKKGHLVGHIKDIGHNPADPDTRLYATHEAQPFHNDAADLVSLLSLHAAREGGLSSWASSVAVHNEILRRRPDLARVLAGPWFFDRKGEIPAGKRPFFELPTFNYHAGYLTVNFSANYFRLSQRHEAVPRFTQEHLDAMELFESLAASDELRMDMLLQPGDIQLLNNHTCLHARTAFTDWPSFDRRRHLLRLWLSPEGDRPLAECYKELLGGSIEPGRRGGITVPPGAGARYNPIPLEAE